MTCWLGARLFPNNKYTDILVLNSSNTIDMLATQRMSSHGARQLSTYT